MIDDNELSSTHIIMGNIHIRVIRGLSETGTIAAKRSTTQIFFYTRSGGVLYTVTNILVYGREQPFLITGGVVLSFFCGTPKSWKFSNLTLMPLSCRTSDSEPRFSLSIRRGFFWFFDFYFGFFPPLPIRIRHIARFTIKSVTFRQLS